MPGTSPARSSQPAGHCGQPASADDGWAPAPSRPRLPGGALHVWRADLTAVSDELAALLCAGERARADRLVSERTRRLWTRSRGVLRALLGLYLQRDPSTMRFSTGPHGKPALRGGGRRSPAAASSGADLPELSFNLSHSRGLALFAFTGAGPVGIDVEVARRPIDELAIAARTFGAEETRHLEDLEPTLRRQEFLRAWTRHEAALKCRGSGIGGSGGSRASAGRLWITGLDVGAAGAAAVALERPARGLRCWEWA